MKYLPLVTLLGVGEVKAQDRIIVLDARTVERFGLTEPVTGDYNPWQTIATPSSELVRSFMAQKADDYSCGDKIRDNGSDATLKIGCYDLGYGVFASHEPITDTCKIVITNNNVSDIGHVTISNLPECNSKYGLLYLVKEGARPEREIGRQIQRMAGLGLR